MDVHDKTRQHITAQAGIHLIGRGGARRFGRVFSLLPGCPLWSACLGCLGWLDVREEMAHEAIAPVPPPVLLGDAV